MTKRIVEGIKDDKGAFIPIPKPQEKPVEVPFDGSIDNLIYRGLRAIYGLMRAIESDIATGSPDRDTVQNLKDAMAILKDLKKEERELLDSMSDEDLEKMLKK
jgi:hypothetical protein